MDNLIRAVLKKSAEEMYISPEKKTKLLISVLTKYLTQKKN